ncbi:hypothetical protein BH10PSE3_BH10PSE3_29260 [soil metagenome]
MTLLIPTDAVRVVAALVIGSLCGGLLLTGVCLYRWAGQPGIDGLAYAPGIFTLSSLFWFFGLLLIGGPALGLLYALKVRSRLAAALTGAVLAFGAMLLLLQGIQPNISPTHQLTPASLIGAAGFVVGWIVTWIAYGGREAAR